MDFSHNRFNCCLSTPFIEFILVNCNNDGLIEFFTTKSFIADITKKTRLEVFSNNYISICATIFSPVRGSCFSQTLSLNQVTGSEMGLVIEMW